MTKYKIFILIVIIILLFGTNACYERIEIPPPDHREYYIDPEIKDIIDTTWENVKPSLINKMYSALANKNPYVLYNIQVYTNNLLKYACYCKDYETLDDLAELYLIAYDYLELKYEYTYLYLPGHARETICPLYPPARMWTMWIDDKEFEVILVSSQFLYLVSNAINLFLDIDESKRTPKMNEFIENFSSVIINDHYLRWIYAEQGMFQLKGWECDNGVFNHYNFLRKKYNREFGTLNNYSYCNGVTDIDTWILAGVVEILAANKKNSNLVPLTLDEEERLLNYVSLGTKLLKSRMTESNLTNFDGDYVKGLNFDLGAWDEYYEYAYSGYIGETFPTENDKVAAENVGWDISHARRLVHVFETLWENRYVTGQFFPDENVMKGLTNQVIYEIFNKDFKKPLFTNYIDGTNGWYRVNYENRTGFGYPPYGLSTSIMSGGYGFWSKYNPDMTKVTDALWNMINVIWYNLDQEIVEFAQKNYVSQIYENYVRNTSLKALYRRFNKSNSLTLLMFLPSLVESKVESNNEEKTGK